MAKFYGSIGYVETVETTPGVWKEVITEKPCYGDLIKSSRNLSSSGEINDDVTLSNNVSIISDPYTVNNIANMRYITFRGTKWKITSVDIDYPRLTLVTGGVYHGE